MKINSKKAQSTAPAIIIFIAIFFVLYVYLIPFSEKCKLMPDLQECLEQKAENDRVNYRNLAEIEPEIFIEEKIGFLPVQNKYSVYSMRPMDLFNSEELEIATILEKESVIGDWFSDDEKKGVFSINERSEGVKIFIYISKGKGDLKININPEAKFVIKEEDLSKEMPVEIDISSENLDDMNIIRLRASKPLNPFIKNYFEIEKVIVKETYRLTDDNVRNNLRINENLENIDSAYLYYNPSCLTKEELSITLNNKEIRKGVLCKEELINVTGNIKFDNIIVFSTDGNYFINPAKLHIKFKRANNTLFYFDINDNEYEQIKKGIALVFFRMDFDSTENKKIDVYINNELLDIDTENLDYETAINKYIEKGKNKIEIASKTDTKVNLLKVEIR